MRIARIASSSCLLLAACTAPNPEYVQPGLDGSSKVDMAGQSNLPFMPSHVGPEWFYRSPGTLRLGFSVDTSALTLDGMPPPSDVTFVEQQGFAVLALKSLEVPGQANVRVRGSRPLIVVAGSSISVGGILDGTAHNDEPGPGGAGPELGPGAGKKGGGSPLDTGGGGAGHGAIGGAAGGVGGNCPQPPSTRNPGGGAYGDSVLTQLLGGSGGGGGVLTMAGCPVGSDAHGGAGGGAIQLTAGDSIIVSGTINVGGGGGKGGCKNPIQVDSGSGGGGGSGGSLLLESRIVTLGGNLAANGGGGGGGAFYTSGGNGADGYATTDSAPGGAGGRDLPMGGNEVVPQRGGLGGAMGIGGDSQMAGNCGNSGGGGGAAGRIYIRSRSAVKPGSVSPPANIVTL